MFKEMIHKKPLPPIQKMWYLKTNLTGEAERLIRHLTLTANNYETAWETLQNRFNNKRLLTSALFERFFGQKHATDQPSASALKALHDTTKETLMALRNLAIDTTSWDPILLHLLLKKLDKNTRIAYEQSLENPKELPTLKHFLKFVETRFQSLEASGQRKHISRSLTTVVTSKAQPGKCPCCNEQAHPLFICQTFLKMPIQGRLQFLKDNKLCLNCLRPGHWAKVCTSRSCTKCNHKHHTLIHLEGNRCESTPKQLGVTPSTETGQQSTTLIASKDSMQRGYVLLSTALVKIIGNNGKETECRAILDSGSQVNLLSRRLIKKLALSTKPATMNIQGIGSGHQRTQQRVNIGLQSRINGFSTRLEAFILPDIISPQPTHHFDITKWSIPKNITLADPKFNHPDNIDVLLGAEFYHQLMSVGQIRLGDDLPTLQNTVFGWILSGKIGGHQMNSVTCGICSEDDDDTNRLLERLWKLDNIEPLQSTLSPSERLCESHFVQHTTRNNEGRFMVRIPFTEGTAALGDSRKIAINRFLTLEHRLAKNDDIRRQYVDFMDQYQTLNHMSEVDIRDKPLPHYFIPHHCVFKPDSSTTKLRVVFDASSKTSTGVSLNDMMHTGPSTQGELFSILLRFRLPRFVFTTDIQQMYRQILVHLDDRRYQLIVWRRNPQAPLKYFELNTVTYGTRSAPYLATRCLKQIAIENAISHPLGAQFIQDNFYVDDGLGGSDSLATALEGQRQLIYILNKYGFNLRKWCANHPQLLHDIPQGDQEVNLDFTDDYSESIKTLGLTWLPKSDQFCLKVNLNPIRRITKRSVTSDIARLFDPLGILAPVVMIAKLFIQSLWQLKSDWDEALPEELHTRWQNFRNTLCELSNFTFSRHIYQNEIPTSIQLHAFSDASEKAYGTAVYIRSVFKSNKTIVRLLCAKSRVAPLKCQTVPRLELCAALLSAELVNRVKNYLKLINCPTFLWTDSQIVLSWINSESSSFQTFVANRVATIQSLTLMDQWRHVGTKDNPADIVSRGLSPREFSSSNMWHYGPLFLHGSETIWPRRFNPQLTNATSLEKKQRNPISLITIDTDDVVYTIDHKNSFRTLQRIIGYVHRFINNTRHKGESRHTQIELTPTELDQALVVIIQAMQKAEFKEEMVHLKKHKELKGTTSLKGLSPFLDDMNILRVGGRLEASTLPYDSKHQILIT